MKTGSKPHLEADEKAIDKSTGGKTIFYPRGLNITWGNDDRYWRIDNANMARNSVAELIQVSWLEVTCVTDNVESGEKYNVGFDVTLKPDAFGWNGIEVYVMAKVGKMGKFSFKKFSLGNKTPDERFRIPDQKSDPLVIEVNSSGGDKSLHLGLYEVWSEKWKGGLKIHDAFVEQV